MLTAVSRALLVASIMSASNPDPSAAKSAAATPEPGLNFSITASKPAYVLYEPVVLTLRLSNASSRRVSMAGSLFVPAGMVDVSITDPNGTRSRYNPGSFVDTFGLQIDLAAGEAEESTEVVAWNGMSRRLAFPTIGTYRVDATAGVSIDDKGVNLEAKSVAVRIEEPSSADTRFAERIGSSAELVTILTRMPSTYCKGKASPNCFEQLRAFVREIPDSAYAPFVLYYLAADVESDALPITPKSAVVVDLYEELLERWPHHELHSAVYGQLGMALTKAGNRRAAGEYFKKLETEFPSKKRAIRKFKEDFERGED